MGPDGTERDEVVQPLPLDDLDQTPDYDPSDPEPIPEDHFDQSGGEYPPIRSGPAGGVPRSPENTSPQTRKPTPPARS